MNITGVMSGARVCHLVCTLAISVLLTSLTIAPVYSSDSVPRAPGWGDLLYEPPAAGSYELPVILPATDGEVVTSDGTTVRLFDLMSDRAVLLSFIFTRCSDVNGCPLANAVLYKVQSRLGERPDLAEQVSLLSVSFDPEYDTPDVTGAFEKAFRKDDIEWNFLTTQDQAELQNILDGYGQFAVRVHDHHGHETDEYAHLLRVYLIDRQQQIRNIYSVSYLHPDILMNDLETLFLESAKAD